MAARDGLALLWSANPAQSLGRPLGHLRQHARATIVQAVVGPVTAFAWIIYSTSSWKACAAADHFIKA
jgi:hypothetical protein